MVIYTNICFVFAKTVRQSMIYCTVYLIHFFYRIKELIMTIGVSKLSKTLAPKHFICLSLASLSPSPIIQAKSEAPKQSPPLPKAYCMPRERHDKDLGNEFSIISKLNFPAHKTHPDVCYAVQLCIHVHGIYSSLPFFIN